MRLASEAVEVYTSNIRRLVELAGFEGSDQDQIVKLTYVNGFSESISVALKQLSNVKTLETAKRILEVAVAVKPRINKEPRQVDGGGGLGQTSISIVGVHTCFKTMKSQGVIAVTNRDTS